jgi:hypothetical protein
MCEGKDGTVWTFDDCYSKKAPEVTVPALVPADPCSCYSAPFSVTWDCLCDACVYDIEFALDEDFTMPVEAHGTMGTGANPSFSVYGGKDGGLSCEMDYYVRVRAVEAGTCQGIVSWWSEPKKFTVAPSVGAGVITLVAPVPGALDQPIKNVGFSWSILASADKFDWVLSKNADLSNPVESKTGLTRTAYTCTKTLEYGTTYYWQVTAYKEGVAISVSHVGIFRTVAEPVPPPPAEVPPTPFWVWVVIAIGAVLVIVVIVLIFRTRRV